MLIKWPYKRPVDRRPQKEAFAVLTALLVWGALSVGLVLLLVPAWGGIGYFAGLGVALTVSRLVGLFWERAGWWPR